MSQILHRIELDPLPLALTFILVATAVPVEIRAPLFWDGEFGGADFLRNLLLYAPLGLALSHRSVWFTLLCALAVSSAIELWQVWSVARFASPWDVLANTLSAVAARCVCGMGGRIQCGHRWRVHPRLIPVLFLVTLVLGTLWMKSSGSSAISTWDSDYPLLLGNELTADRPWQGTIASLSISSGVDTVEGGDALYETDVPVTAMGGPAVALSARVARDFVAAATHANSFSVRARIVPANVQQSGPARIVSFSIDPFHRNFDLGQNGESLVLRVRTALTGPNGTVLSLISAPALEAGKPAHIRATYDGAVSRLYLNDKLIGRANLAAMGCTFASFCDTQEPLVWAAMGGLLTIVWLGLLPWRSDVVIGLAAGAAAGTVLVLGSLRPESLRIASPDWAPWMAMLGAATVGLSAGVKRSLRSTVRSGQVQCSR